MDPTRCILCAETLDTSDTVIVTRGLETLRKCSLSRQDGIYHILEGVESITVHVVCRKHYTRRLDEPSSSYSAGSDAEIACSRF